MKMKKKNIVNIVNFVRGCEPRCEIDLYEPVAKQVELLAEYQFSGTFLLQYDALLREDMVSLMKSEANAQNELGVWLEIVQPLCDAAGIPWRGRFPWDWEASVGFSVGYTSRERELLIDCLFEKFRKTFGYYPKVMASWIIDAHSLTYAHERYGLDASANCKDQWGTDGYTLWGAYYNGGYYPSRDNVFCPGETEENTLKVPIFRMLGSDPIYQYDAGLSKNGSSSCQGVVTLEPVYREAGGGNPAWVDWYFSQMFNNKCLAYSYVQVGQENSFGWPAMKDGLMDQFEKLSRLAREGKILVEPLGATGRAFTAAYDETPPTSVVCETDWKNPKNGKRSYWYNCKNYRVNILADGEGIRIRDFTLFREKYQERYQTDPCVKPYLQFDNLPLVDGNRFSGSGLLAGGYLTVKGLPVIAQKIVYTETTDRTGFLLDILTSKGSFTVYVMPNGIRIRSNTPFALALLGDKTKAMPYMEVSEKKLSCVWRGYSYTVALEGIGSPTPQGAVISPVKGNVGLFVE